MNLSNIKIVPYDKKYADETVQMWRESKERAIGQREKHSFQDHISFLHNILLKQYTVELALDKGQVAGIIVYNKEEINQLYIHSEYQGIGIGEKLLQRAKDKSSGRLTLYTFEVNKAAQRFYEKHGFKIISRGHENEENLPDIQYEWCTDSSFI